MGEAHACFCTGKSINLTLDAHEFEFGGNLYFHPPKRRLMQTKPAILPTMCSMAYKPMKLRWLGLSTT